MVNIPRISLFQWHPFTVSSAEKEFVKESTFHIRGMLRKNKENNNQNLEFTAKLHEILLANAVENKESKNKKLALKVENDFILRNELEIHLDGPYGATFDYNLYDKIILVAGGIGITPCHSIIDTMLGHYKLKQTNNNNVYKNMKLPQNISLIWAVRDDGLFNMFEQTWQKAENVS